MTCVVGVADGSKVWMGADSAGVSGYNIRETRVPKVFKRGPFLIGYTSSFRMGQILQYNLNTKILKSLANKRKSMMKFMVVDFVSAVRELFKEKGYTKIQDNVEAGGFFMVGFRGHLYEIESDFQVQEYRPTYHAIGCGASYAFGVLYNEIGVSVKERSFDVEKVINSALAAATYFSAGVSSPHKVLCI